MYEPAVHLSSRTSCYSTSYFQAQPHQRHLIHLTLPTVLLLTGKALGASVPYLYLTTFLPRKDTSPSLPSVLKAPPSDHIPQPPYTLTTSFTSLHPCPVPVCYPLQMAGFLKDGPVLHPSSLFQVTPSAAKLATAGMPCPTTRKLASLIPSWGCEH